MAANKYSITKAKCVPACTLLCHSQGLIPSSERYCDICVTSVDIFLNISPKKILVHSGKGRKDIYLLKHLVK